MAEDDKIRYQEELLQYQRELGQLLPFCVSFTNTHANLGNSLQLSSDHSHVVSQHDKYHITLESHFQIVVEALHHDVAISSIPISYSINLVLLLLDDYEQVVVH